MLEFVILVTAGMVAGYFLRRAFEDAEKGSEDGDSNV